ncbi:hypothetical protein [Streptomyces sp. NBC_00102]|uniref:hypothetical protein n=1 Tax=Streptomyces sp. NBC_00102 TaxID=2975652 RepID=UPI00224EB90E|nr:hypothetical protein [Streptomyces sp. NBC_00102]MCX5397275.1 hypothetical protein [Streptomyces sp. NBC_00102]
MPASKHHQWKPLPDTVSCAKRRFVAQLRKVREESQCTQAEIAQAIPLAASSLSNHLNGGRVPEEAHLASLFANIETEVIARGGQMPCSLSTLLELREKALFRHCACCSRDTAASVSLSETSPGGEAGEEEPPIPRSAHRVLPRHLRTRRYGRRTKIEIPTRTDVPVPLQQGDRHTSSFLEETWPAAVSELADTLSTSRYREADIMMWSAATNLTAHDVQVFVAGCRAAGLEEAANQVLTTAARRDAQAVISIAAALHEQKQYDDAGRLLTAASQAREETFTRSR